MTSIHEAAAVCLRLSDPVEKCVCVQALEQMPSDHHAVTGEVVAVDGPGIPARPELVHPGKVARRKLTTREGHAAFIHAICHIEFSAINLALDALARYSAMPDAYYQDWLAIAAEEALHFSLLEQHLQDLGYHYGDFPAHNGLWEMADKTADDLLQRMALVPRVLEARGLDVTPDMIKRLNAIDDTKGSAILERILKDEIGHVAAGTRWFNYVAAQRGLEPEQAFVAIVAEAIGCVRSDRFNTEARKAAGFTKHELHALANQDSDHAGCNKRSELHRQK